MRSFFIVFNFELKETLKKKSLIISTLVLALVVFIITAIPTLQGSGAPEPMQPDQGVVTPIYEFDGAFVFDNPEDYGVLSAVFDIETTFDTEDDLRRAVENREVPSGFVIKNLKSFKYITLDSSEYNYESYVFGELLRSIAINQSFEEYNIDSELVNSIFQTELVTLGKDSTLGTPIALAIMFAVYLLILLYGNGVSTSVAREKDSRTMELLITSTDTRQLILGKVFAAGLAGIIQVSVIILSGVIGFMLFKGSYPESILAFVQGEMSLDVLGVYVLFSVSGYLLYLFIFAALGSLVSKVEDVAGVTTPITMLFVIAYLVATFSMQMPNSKLTTISSYIPFSSIFTMPIRYMLTTVKPIEILIGFAIMIATTYLLSVLSIQIYRYGSLNYGNKLKLTNVVKDLIKDRKKK